VIIPELEISKEHLMLKYFGAMMLALGLLGLAFAADTVPAPSTAPATATKPALPACCGDTCKKMVNCCQTDAAGKTTCAMGGGCCVKP
jgi:hypothetical protein